MSSAMVMRSGSQLVLNGHSFRFAGVNIYWLGLSDVASTSGAQYIPTSTNGLYYPSRTAIEDACAPPKKWA